MKINDYIKLLLLATVSFGMIGLLGYFLKQMKHEYTIKIYNCQMAEISPDMPPKLKEECRRLLRKK